MDKLLGSLGMDKKDGLEFGALAEGYCQGRDAAEYGYVLGSKDTENRIRGRAIEATGGLESEGSSHLLYTIPYALLWISTESQRQVHSTDGREAVLMHVQATTSLVESAREEGHHLGNVCIQKRHTQDSVHLRLCQPLYFICASLASTTLTL